MNPVATIAEQYVSESMQLDPCHATVTGISEFDHLLTDYSPDGYQERANLVHRILNDAEHVEIASAAERRGRDLLRERLQVFADTDTAGEWMRTVRNMSSPAQDIRRAFDLMATEGGDALDKIVSRLSAVPAALASYVTSLEVGRSAGVVASRRQAAVVAHQAATWATDKWFSTFAAKLDADQHAGRILAAAAAGADAAYAEFAAYMGNVYAPEASPIDAVGSDRYQLATRRYLGADLDPREMYDWAWHEFAELQAEIRATCHDILPGASFDQVRDLLDTDPDRCLTSAEAYQAWLQELTDSAITNALAHFDIPEPMRRCEALIPPAGSAAAAYYTAPAEDFSRPARTWYPLMGREVFPKWGDVTTCYHESVPGHHLQIGYAMAQGESLNRHQRICFISGHGEGWALYAERLCDEMGWFTSPDYRLGFLCGQMLRIVRVIIDIGMHLQYRIPADARRIDGTPFHPGDVWTPELAVDFALAEAGHPEVFVRSEIDRYLGMPAQAISYKIGEREWIHARDDARRHAGASFDLKHFHTRALALGAMGLDQLRRELLADSM